MRVWTGFKGSMARFCGHRNEPSVSIEVRGILEQLGSYQLLNKDYAPWSWWLRSRFDSLLFKRDSEQTFILRSLKFRTTAPGSFSYSDCCVDDICRIFVKSDFHTGTCNRKIKRSSHHLLTWSFWVQKSVTEFYEYVTKKRS